MNTEILKAALLGTDRHMPEVPPNAPEIFAKIQALPTSKEDRFLKIAFVSLLHEEAGTKPLTIDSHLPECPPEPQPVVTGQLAGLLQSALKEQNEVLFAFLVFRAVQRKEVVQPQLVPALLDKALEKKHDKEKLMHICGVTGQWLCTLNPRWKLLLDGTAEDENVWETGSTQARKAFLSALRKTDPVAAIALLEKTLAQENANNRLAFLQLLNEGLSIPDEPFLQKLLTDKSQKVRETAIGMLRQIQGSEINRSHLEWLLRMVVVRDERHLVVTKKKKIIIAEGATLDETIFKTGIEMVSTEKGVHDHVFIAGQLLSAIDPVTIANALNMSDQELITLFLEHPSAKALVPFLTSAAVRFKCKSWALALLHRGDARDIGLLDALSPSEQLPFYLQFLNGNAANLFGYLLDDTYSPLPQRLAEQLLDHLSKFPYDITQATYQRLALQLPVGIMPVLIKYTDDPRQDYQLRYFKNQASEMMRMVELRKNIA